MKTKKERFILSIALALTLAVSSASIGWAAETVRANTLPQAEKPGGGPAPSAWAFSNGLNGTLPVSDLVCPTANICFAGTANQVFKSTDGGKTFFTVYKSERIEPAALAAKPSLWFVDQKRGYAGIAGLGNTAVKTTDGGSTWMEVKGPAYAGRFAFFDKKRGISGIYGGVLHTSDYGKTWSSGKVVKSEAGNKEHELENFVFTKPSLLPTSHSRATAFLAGTERESRRSYLFKTIDGGKSWKVIGSALPSKPTALIFKDQKRGWIGMENGKIYRTQDGGISWEENELSNVEVKDVDCLNVKTCYAITTGSIHFTDDGGAHWSFLQPISVQGPILQERVHLIDRQVVLIGGNLIELTEKTEKPVVAYTNNGGFLDKPH